MWDTKGQCHVLHSNSGADQGDPFAPLLFALGIKPRLAELEEALRRLATTRGERPERVHILAFLDDITVVASLGLATEALHIAQEVLAPFGLSLQINKT